MILKLLQYGPLLLQILDAIKKRRASVVFTFEGEHYIVEVHPLNDAPAAAPSPSRFSPMLPGQAGVSADLTSLQADVSAGVAAVSAIDGGAQ